jgi:cell fate regulator YaaT (PSP1 superfamily)
VGMVCAVSFERYGRLYYLDPGPHQPRVGDKVLVPTDSGPEVAECVWAPQWVSEDVGGLPTLAGIAGAEHLERDERNRARRAEAKVAAKRSIRRHQLPMKVVAVDYVDADNAFTVYFAAPHRVDFRAVARELARDLAARVELRQLGAREEARAQGGIGPCGRDLCCATFLSDFEPVSVRMAKDQDLPVNPLKISGACGRLMCCLKYEHPLYMEARATWPKRGETVDTPQGRGRVVGQNVPAETVTVRLAESGRSCRCRHADVCAPRQAYEREHQDTGTPSPAPGRGRRVRRWLGAERRSEEEPEA